MNLDSDRLRQSLDKSTRGRSSERHKPAETEILRRRSAEMAARAMKQEEIELFAEVVVVRRGDTRLGVPIASVIEVREVELTALPHSTEVVNGLFQVRGQTFCLIDIGPFFNATSPLSHGDRTPAILVSGPPGEVGIRVDEVLGPRTVATDELVDGLHGGTVDFVTNVTRDLVEIIDVKLLLSLPAMRVRKQL
ncbi:MAG: chemotaxis protein CheW [Thermoanaerobaculales bacterium]